jgi:hypothetical protein
METMSTKDLERTRVWNVCRLNKWCMSHVLNVLGSKQAVGGLWRFL